MRILHRAQHLSKKHEALIDAKVVVIAVLGDGRAFDVLEGEIGLPVFGKAGVEQLRDVRVIQTREDLALAGHALAHRSSHQHRMDELQRDPSREEPIDPLGEPNRAHASLAKLR